MGYTFPSTYGERCYLVPIDVALIPFVSGAIRKFEERRLWQSESDWEEAYPAFAALQEAMASSCALQITESIDRLYRLIDSTFNGAEYLAEGSPPVISPPIPEVPDPQNYVAPGLRRQLRDLQGEVDEGWFGFGGRPATIADLVAALRRTPEGQATAIDGALDTLDGIDDASDVINTVRGLFQTGEDVVADGAQLILTGTTGVGTIAMLGLLGQMLRQHRLLLTDIKGLMERLVTSLDGGGEAPAANVVDELEEIRTLLG